MTFVHASTRATTTSGLTFTLNPQSSSNLSSVSPGENCLRSALHDLGMITELFLRRDHFGRHLDPSERDRREQRQSASKFRMHFGNQLCDLRYHALPHNDKGFANLFDGGSNISSIAIKRNFILDRHKCPHSWQIQVNFCKSFSVIDATTSSQIAPASMKPCTKKMARDPLPK